MVLQNALSVFAEQAACATDALPRQAAVLLILIDIGRAASSGVIYAAIAARTFDAFLRRRAEAVDPLSVFALAIGRSAFGNALLLGAGARERSAGLSRLFPVGT